MTVFVEVVGRGPDLTLLHGWGLNGAVWNGVREALAEHYTLHIVDLPGHGRSRAVVATLDAFVDALLAAMPAKSHLIGWSLGGHVALALAAHHPERVGCLVTVCSTPRFVAAEDWPQGKRVEVLAGFADRLASDHAATIRNFLALQVLNQPQARDVARSLQEAVNAFPAPHSTSLAAALEILKTSDIRALVPTIAAPVLVVQGDRDALTPVESAQWLADNLPHARYCLIDQAAHAPFLSHRRLFLDRVLGFLSQ